MSTDRLLTTVLQAYQTIHDPVQTNRILGSTTSLLTTLANPLNVTLLTSQLLHAPAIWNLNEGLPTCLRIISIFNTAAITVRQHELDRSSKVASTQGGGLGCNEWATAIIKGADDKSPRWRHLLVMAGVILGMEGQNRRGLSRGLKSTLEGALVTAANLALQEPDGVLGQEAIALALAHTSDLIHDSVKRGLNFDALAPIIIHAMIGPSCYQEGYFIRAANKDIAIAGKHLDWSGNSQSFLQLQQLSGRPLVSAIGPLSRLMAYSIDHMRDSREASIILEQILIFTAALIKNWRVNKLSEIDPDGINGLLSTETSRVTFPAFWQVLKTAMFAIVVILRAIIGRTLVDPILASDLLASSIASRTLQALRNIYFISSRMGANAFSAYTFVYLTSIDILSRYPVQSKLFLQDVRPDHLGRIPSHALDRNLDLFFLNTCEHFTLTLSPADNESLVIAAAIPYLTSRVHKNLMEIFEAAHSATLAALAAPQNAELTTKFIPFYTQALFQSFPSNLSPRQFRFAFKTLLQITTPPSPLAASQPLLPDILLELLHHRASHAPTVPLPQDLMLKSPADAESLKNSPALSEQAVLTLALLDALPFLPLASLSEWLPLAADLMNAIDDPSMRDVCKARFWEVLESGEMDIERAAVCVAWWSTRSGREKVLFRRNGEGVAMMSGALPVRDESRL